MVGPNRWHHFINLRRHHDDHLFLALEWGLAGYPAWLMRMQEVLPAPVSVNTSALRSQIIDLLSALYGGCSDAYAILPGETLGRGDTLPYL